MSLTASVRKAGGVTIIDLDGRLTLGDAAESLRNTVLRELESNSRLILNLAGVSYLDSAGLAEMVAAQATVARRNGTIRLLNVQQRIRDLLEMTRLNRIFECFDDESAAVRSFGTAAGV
jgi:anti-sigma B factor antagonist